MFYDKSMPILIDAHKCGELLIIKLDNQCYHTTCKSPSFILLNLKCLDDNPNGIRVSTFVMVEPKRNGTMGRPHVNKGRIFFETVNDFLGECSLHGFKYFPKSRWFVKVLWVSKD